MYSCVKLNLYCEETSQISQDIKTILTNQRIPFKELRNSTLLFSAIKNPDNIVIVVISNQNLLSRLKSFSKKCYNYQNRIFAVFKNAELLDNFFEKSFIHNQLNTLSESLQEHEINQHIPKQPSKLLVKLVQFELHKLQISSKYIGFNYLTQLAVNYLCNNYPSSTYIELFEYVASLNLASIDTIERDVRHMILTTWKTNSHFRNMIQQTNPLEKPNSKNILIALLSYLKNTI